MISRRVRWPPCPWGKVLRRVLLVRGLLRAVWKGVARVLVLVRSQEGRGPWEEPWERVALEMKKRERTVVYELVNFVSDGKQ